MSSPVVSVLMITYNHKPYITRAIEGVLQQKVDFSFELVIGEDCSTDGTREIIFEFQKIYPEIIKVISSEKNVGAKENAKRTRISCEGKYVAYCEGDDFWNNPNKLQIQVDFLENNPEFGMVFSDHNQYYVKTNKIIKDYLKYHYKKEIPLNPTITDIVLGKSGIHTCTVMIRRFLLEEIIKSDFYLHQGGLPMGDVQIWSEAAVKMKIQYIPETLATYTVLEESASHSKNSSYLFKFNKSALEMLLYLCNKYNLPKETINKIKSDYGRILLRIAFYKKNYDFALEVKKLNYTFSWKEWLMFYTIKNSILHFTICMFAKFLTYFKKSK